MLVDRETKHISNQNKNIKIILKWMLLFETNTIKEPEQHSDKTTGLMILN